MCVKIFYFARQATAKKELRGVFDKEAHWKRDKNIKDVLTHLYEWHNLLLDWGGDGDQRGMEKQFLKEGCSWKPYGDMMQNFGESIRKFAETLLDDELCFEGVF